jgi:hypothetical protein
VAKNSGSVNFDYPEAMKQLDEVTIVAVAGIEVRRAIAALRISIQNLSFGNVKLLTHQKPRWCDSRIEYIPIRQLNSYIEYNRFIIFELSEYVDTSHCLLIQADGYVRNPESWDEEFLAYDYIGAPWPVIPSAYIDPFGNHQRVGNGGFSLRSKRLLSTPQRMPVEWDANHGEFYRHMDYGLFNEDGLVCVHNRHVYELDGCQFAPVEVAMRFSREIRLTDLPLEAKPFGFHRYGLRTGRPTKAPYVFGFPAIPAALDQLRIH